MSLLKFRQRVVAPVMEADEFGAFADNSVLLKHLTTTITSTQLLALFATPRAIVPAPGANLATLFLGAMVYKPAGTAYAGIAAGEDLSIKYTDASGLEVSQCETTGFLDQASAQTRWMRPHGAASGVNDLTPIANAVLVMQLLVGEIITGTSPLVVRVVYRVLPTVLS